MLDFDQNIKHKLCKGPSNDHYYQVGFGRRRLNCKSLQTTTITEYKVITIDHMTL